MDIEWSENDLAFRDEVRAFLDERLTPELRRADRLMTSVYADHDASMRWQAILYERGWAAPAWPVEHGGCDWSLTQRYIFSRESILAGAPSLSPMGIQQVAHVITEFGTPEQKAYFLPRILTGEAFFCQGYSEPDGLGPRLAEHERRRGRRRPHLHRQQDLDHPCPRGQLDVLPGPDHPRRKKQQGITFLLIDMTVPGIEVRPLVMTSGEQIQNQEFFDHVRVPKSNVIGEIDDGWTVAKYLLEFERGGVAAAPRLQVMADEVAQAASAQPGPDGRPLIDCPSFAAKLADARIRIDVLEILEFRVLSAAAAGGNPGSASSMLKILGTELSQTLTELLLEAAGPRGRAYQPHATRPGGPLAGFAPPADGYLSGEEWQAVAPLRYFNDRAGSIYAGSNEIQRNIIAKAALEL